MRSMKSVLPLGVCAWMVVTGCGPEKPTPTPAAQLTTVTVTCAPSAVEAGQSAKCEASAADQKGQPFTVPGYTWATSDESVAKVSAEGQASTLARGSVTIRASATADGVTQTGETTLTVTPATPKITEHNGPITANETWRASDNPHVVTLGVMVGGAANPTLTLEPGVVVRFARGAALYVGLKPSEPGVLVAEGTAAAPIVLTANGDAPMPGAWNGVSVANAKTSSRLSHVTLEYAGGSSLADENPDEELFQQVGALSVRGSTKAGESAPPLFLDTVVVKKSKRYGVMLSNVTLTPDSARLTVQDSGRAGISMAGNDVGTLPKDTLLSGNTPNAVDLTLTQVTRTQTWPKLNYRLLPLTEKFGGTLSVSSPSGVTLTLLPGTEVWMTSDAAITVGLPKAGGSVEPGALVAQGTAEAPIRFVPDPSAATPIKGFWSGLLFYGAPGSRLEHVVIDHAGAPYSGIIGGAGINVSKEQGAFVTNTTIQNSSGCGFALSPYETMTTDFTLPEYGNVFTDNAEASQCEK